MPANKGSAAAKRPASKSRKSRTPRSTPKAADPKRTAKKRTMLVSKIVASTITAEKQKGHAQKKRKTDTEQATKSRAQGSKDKGKGKEKGKSSKRDKSKNDRRPTRRSRTKSVSSGSSDSHSSSDSDSSASSMTASSAFNMAFAPKGLVQRKRNDDMKSWPEGVQINIGAWQASDLDFQAVDGSQTMHLRVGEMLAAILRPKLPKGAIMNISDDMEVAVQISVAADHVPSSDDDSEPEGDVIFESGRDAVVDAAKRVGPPAEAAQRCLRDAFKREDICVNVITPEPFEDCVTAEAAAAHVQSQIKANPNIVTTPMAQTAFGSMPSMPSSLPTMPAGFMGPDTSLTPLNALAQATTPMNTIMPTDPVATAQTPTMGQGPYDIAPSSAANVMNAMHEAHASMLNAGAMAVDAMARASIMTIQGASLQHAAMWGAPASGTGNDSPPVWGNGGDSPSNGMPASSSNPGGRYFREPEYPGIPASGGLSDQAQGSAEDEVEEESGEEEEEETDLEMFDTEEAPQKDLGQKDWNDI